MRPGRHWLPALGLCMICLTPAVAQDLMQLPSPILTLDQEALFNGSQVAEGISSEIEKLTAELSTENRAIEAQLIAEELDLTERRPTMAPGAFRVLADAFDAKVQRIRAEQDAKVRDLQRLRERERQTFLRRITPILSDIVRERGALAVLDRRSVFLSADNIDITQEAIDRINAAFEAGEVPAAPLIADPDQPPDSGLGLNLGTQDPGLDTSPEDQP